jgi:succinoglycan biosynthesis protein ExoA
MVTGTSIDPSRVDVSVLIPVRNEAAFLGAMIDTLLAQRFDGAAEFLFLDGHSSDSTRSILESAAQADPRIRVLDNPGTTIPRALNLGLREARGDLIVRMDAHALYPSNYLAAGIARLNQGDVSCVTAPQISVGMDTWSRRAALALGTWLGTGGSPYRTELREEIEVDRGFGGIWHRETLIAHQGWDEDSPINEDTELAARIRAGGGRIVCLPELLIRSIPRSSLSALSRQYLRYGYYRARTAALHRQSVAPSHALPPGLVLAVGMALCGTGRAARLARGALLAYASALLTASVQTARRAERADATALPLVFATMHLSWGVGYLAGCMRFKLGIGGPGMSSRPPTAFRFGRNWLRYVSGYLDPERERIAAESLRETVGELAGRNFLDIGSGSGLFSLCAHRAGAARVISVDVDPDAVAATRQLHAQAGSPESWQVLHRSIVADDLVAELGLADVVYAWGVLHHTGDMYTAIRNAAALVAPGGRLAISIYNRVTEGLLDSERWWQIKRVYNRVPRTGQILMEATHSLYWAAGCLRHRQNPVRVAREYRQARGMAVSIDLVDWLGGFPYEFAAPDEIVAFCEQRCGLRCMNVLAVGAGNTGNNEFLFERPLAAPSESDALPRQR